MTKNMESQEIYNNPDIAISIISNSSQTDYNYIKKLNPTIKDNFDVMLVAVKKNWRLLYHASNRLRDNNEIVLAAVSNYGAALRYASDRLKQDEKIVLAAIQNYPSSLCQASPKLRESDDFLIEAYKTNSKVIKYFDEEKRKKLKNKITAVDYMNTIDPNLLAKLKKMYYKSYYEKVASKNSKKDNDLDFYITIIKSNVLEDIFKSNYFTLSDAQAIESSCVLLFNGEECKQLVSKIKRLIEKYRNINIKIYNDIIKNRDNKEELNRILQIDELKLDEVIHYIINNKYYDGNMKTAALSVIYENYDPKKVIRVQDIFEILIEMNERKLTIEQILKEKNIDINDFYKIYKTAEENNPILFEKIKESLYTNKIRGFKKFMTKGYLVLNCKKIMVDNFEEEYGMDIYKFLDSYKGTELYIKLLEKFSKLEEFDMSRIDNNEENIKYGM